MRHAVDDLGGRVHLEQRHARRAGDVQQDAPGTVDRGLQQRTGDRRLRCGDSAVLAAGLADTHQRRAGTGQDHLDVGEVGVDQSGRGDEVGDARHALQQDLVGHLEGIEHAGLFVGDGQQAIVGNDDQRVDLLLQALHTGVGLDGTAATFEAEWPSDDTDGQGADAARQLGDDRRCARACTATLAGGDEHHVGALDDFFDLVTVRLCRVATDVGVTAGAESAGEITPDVELHVGVAHQERLRVGVHGNELDPLEAGVDHPVDGIDATTADADHLDDCEIILRCACHQGSLRSADWRMD